MSMLHLCCRRVFSAVRCVALMRHHISSNPALRSHPPSFSFRNLSNYNVKICWKCGMECRKSEPFFCPCCRALQKPESTSNFFHLLGITESYDLDLNALSRNFRKLQSELHPDKFMNASEDEKSYSADISATVNRAYRTLGDPLERGLYLMNLHGVSIPEDTQLTDKAFLMEIMELNEELESAKSKEDVARCWIQNRETLTKLFEEVRHAFSRQDFDAAKDALIKMKYFSSIRSKVKMKLIEFDESY